MSSWPDDYYCPIPTTADAEFMNEEGEQFTDLDSASFALSHEGGGSSYWAETEQECQTDPTSELPSPYDQPGTSLSFENHAGNYFVDPQLLHARNEATFANNAQPEHEGEHAPVTELDLEDAELQGQHQAARYSVQDVAAAALIRDASYVVGLGHPPMTVTRSDTPRPFIHHYSQLGETHPIHGYDEGVSARPWPENREVYHHHVDRGGWLTADDGKQGEQDGPTPFSGHDAIQTQRVDAADQHLTIDYGQHPGQNTSQAGTPMFPGPSTEQRSPRACSERESSTSGEVVCRECGRTLGRPSELGRHIKQQHRKQSRPLNCEYKDCPGEFWWAKDKERHMTTHTGKKNFSCGCGREFTRKDNCQRHKKKYNH